MLVYIEWMNEGNFTWDKITILHIYDKYRIIESCKSFWAMRLYNIYTDIYIRIRSAVIYRYFRYIQSVYDNTL